MPIQETQDMRVRSLGWEDPLKKETYLERKPTVFLPGKFNRQRSLESYSSWGHKKLDTTE